MFIRFTTRVFCEHLLICVCAPFPFGFEDGMSDVIVLIPDHCLSVYLKGDLMKWLNIYYSQPIRLILESI